MTTLTENGSRTNYEWQLYYLHFVDGQLLEIYFKQESGGYRAVPVSELVGELEVTPAISLSFFIFDFYFPISLSPFTISADTVKDISLVYTDVKNIPDIRDTNGDGRALTTQVTIRNIYGYETDITDIVAESDRKPSGGSSSGGGTIAAKYNVVLPDELSNGSVESSLNKAKKGEKVTFTVTPENGYQTASVAVKDAKGNEVEIIDNGDGTYSFTMPDSQVTIIPAFTEIKEPDDPGDQACPRDDSCPITPFTDTNKNEWYHDGVHWAIEKGVMNGTGENTFEPLTATSRAMIVTMLWRMEGSPVVNDQMAFKDVPDDMWFTDAIRWAAASGIVTGYDEDTFGTYDSLTREQMATILYRSAQSKGQGFTGSWAFPLNFDDADQISEWADEAMHWMIMNDIIQGMSDTELSPQGDTVRAQVATMLMRFCDKVS